MTLDEKGSRVMTPRQKSDGGSDPGSKHHWEEEEEEPDPTNPEDLPDYIQPFTYLFNKKTFNQLPNCTK